MDGHSDIQRYGVAPIGKYLRTFRLTLLPASVKAGSKLLHISWHCQRTVRLIAEYCSISGGRRTLDLANESASYLGTIIGVDNRGEGEWGG